MKPQTEMPPEADTEDMSETTEIPASLVDGTPQPGDTITLKVMGVNEQNGTLTVCKCGEEDDSEEVGGSEKMASEFESQPESTT